MTAHRRRLTLLAASLALALAFGLAVPSGQTSRGGGNVLRVDSQPGFDAVDPALAILPQTWQAEYATCLKLFNYPDRAPIGSPLRPVPEAVASIRVSNGGKTYLITIRRGFRFNTGEPVTAATFAHVLNRDLSPAMHSPASAYLADVVGASAVESGRTARAAGISAPGPYQLRIRLAHAVPDFVSRLTLPYFCALPLKTPAAPEGIRAPVPSAGPYYISYWQPDRGAVLERNPFYGGSRPHDVSEIDYTFGASLATQLLLVESGQSDLGQFPPEAAGQLASRYGVNRGRFFVEPQLTVWFLALNREGHLFRNNDPLARAVNYAIDRTALAAQHGAYGGVLTDHILPAGVPGFRNWSIYPSRPDIARAQALAKDHLRDGKATLWTFNISFGPSVAQLVASELKAIGISTHIVEFDPVTLSGKAGTRGAGFDLMLAGWSADYPDPFNFINRLLSGTTIKSVNNNNYSYFDEPYWNERMLAAATLSGRARDRAYALLDRDLMARSAPIAPYLDSNARILVSARVGCFSYQPVYGTDLAALCLK